MALCICVGFSFEAFGALPWLVWLLPVSGVLQVILYRAFRLSPGLTTDKVVRRIRGNRRVSFLLAPGILLGTCMSIVCGGSVGKEAGALQMGASLGNLVAKPFKLKRVFHGGGDGTLDGYAGAVGMAACFSALFFAPLGSCLFVLELTRFKRGIVRHVPTLLVACFVAYGVACLTGIGDIITKVAVPDMAWPIVGQCIMVGVLTAVAGTLFAKAVSWVRALTLRAVRNYFVWVVTGGIIFALLMTVFGWQAFAGTGGDQLNAALQGRFGPWDFAIKMLLTLICLGFWLKGGEIMPSFCIGGLLGCASTFLTGGSAEFACAVGVVSFFAAFSRCPLAAILMGCEIFGWAMAPYLIIGAAVAFWVGSPVGMYGEGIDQMVRRALSKDPSANEGPTSHSA